MKKVTDRSHIQPFEEDDIFNEGVISNDGDKSERIFCQNEKYYLQVHTGLRKGTDIKEELYEFEDKGKAENHQFSPNSTAVSEIY